MYTEFEEIVAIFDAIKPESASTAKRKPSKAPVIAGALVAKTASLVPAGFSAKAVITERLFVVDSV